MREPVKFLACLITVVALCGIWAIAARANPYATAQSTSGPSSATATGGNPVAHGGAASATGGNPVANGGHGGKGGNVVNNISGGGNGNGGGYPSNPRLAASAIAPTILGGGCSGAGLSAALQLPGFGIGGGGVKIDRVCQLHLIGEDAAARELLCQQDDIRRAFSAAGEPCAADLKPYLIAPVERASSTTVDPYDYCATRNAGDKNQHRECDHKG